ncbi:LCP family protein [Bacillus sp. 31A1R]|uniref:Polyisoprenyl-teichoic acid--peptidoglycan teichoic acid transferase TagU n=1 Tax=Robertmurraya mangrovi TaxID=3098077 RepID=A0ABU5IXL8_9BACI|nr:LCP family protein [Bacillus sp. 31A1R]MDZ5471919.1 LCP family protein [Bacillus sp. 31A1R]
MRVENQQKKRKRKWIKNLGIVLVIILLLGGVYAIYLYKQLELTVETIHSDLNREKSDKRINSMNLGKGDPFSLLIMGVDARPGDKGRSDTMIVLTVNPKKKSTKMVSIPRDTRTLIVGRGNEDKINHAYAFGGTEMAVSTVENFLNIPIDYYVTMNMEGFKDIVDAVGGITVDSPISFTEEGISFQEGKNHLNGEKALVYVRMRKQDPRGDYGRQLRQRQVIQGVIQKGANPLILTKTESILAAIGTNAKTDLSFNEMKTIQKNYISARHNMEQIQIEGKGTNINGIYYLIVPSENRNAVSSDLKQHLEL